MKVDGSDLIMCRNPVIHFSEEVSDALHRIVGDLTGTVLLLGPSADADSVGRMLDVEPDDGVEIGRRKEAIL
jgi:chemotaxis methyl-accepting protein methylase